MPLYEYECDACGHCFEVIQKFSDAPLTTCTKCGGPVHKLLSSPAIQFKGSGWYVTDYARAGKSEGASTTEKSDGSGPADSQSESKTDSKSESKTETKTEPKTESKSETKSSDSGTPSQS